MTAPHRTDRLASAGVVLLGVIVAVVAVVAVRNPEQSQAAPTAAHRSSAATHAPRHVPAPATPRTSGASQSTRTTTSPSSPPPALPPVKSIPLVIMNNTTTTGLAAGAEARFQAAGWTVTSIGTLSNDIISTCAYYDPARPGAERAARALQAEYPTIKRVAPRFPDLPEGPIVVVLTWDYVPS